MSKEDSEARKRPASPIENQDEDSDDGWIGPTLSEAAPEKKIRKKSTAI